jgi:UDP:flavonoid glycosyltransferase YjiC (YdhE family)
VKVLAYTSPARGHLNPMMGPLLELRRRGAEVHVRTLTPAVEAVRAAGLAAEPLSPAIEALPHRDHLARTQIQSGAASFATLGARAPHEVPDFEAALDAVRPDLALVDCTTFGAKAVAERRGLRWAECRPFLLEEGGDGVPPFGLGLRPLGAPLGPLRDRVLDLFVAWFDGRSRMPPVNAGRAAAGLPPLRDVAESRHRAPLTLYFTATPFDYPRPGLPASVRMVGPGLWDPPAAAPVELPVRSSSSPVPRSSRTTARSPPRRSPGCTTTTASSSPPRASTRTRSVTPARRWSTASSPTPRSSPTPTWSSATGGWA